MSEERQCKFVCCFVSSEASNCHVTLHLTTIRRSAALAVKQLYGWKKTGGIDDLELSSQTLTSKSGSVPLLLLTVLWVLSLLLPEPENMRKKKVV